MALTVPVAEIVENSKNPLLGKRESWGRVLLGDIATIQNGFPFKSDLFTKDDGVPLIRIRDVGADRSDTRYKGEYDPAYLVHAGDLLIGMDGDFNCARWRGEPALLNQRVCRVSLTSDIYHPRLLDYALPGYLKAINDMTSSVTVKHLSSKSIAEIPLPLPPMDEQVAIVAEIEKQFSRLDEAVANLKRVKANLKRYKAAVLKAAVEGRLVEAEAELARREGRSFDEPTRAQSKGELPFKKRAGRLWGSGYVPALSAEERLSLSEGWAWVKVRDIGYTTEDAVQVGPMSMKSSDFAAEGIPVLNVGCVQWDYIDKSKLNYLPERLATHFERYRIQPGDVLFTRSGTVGRCAVAEVNHRDWLMTFHLLRVRPDPTKCLPKYLRTVFEGATHVRRQAREASIGSTRAGFNTNLLAMLDVPLPPLAEQHRIISEVERRLSISREMERYVDANLRRATSLKSATLARAFSGIWQ